jgi:ABC-2 type transport system permease protein
MSVLTLIIKREFIAKVRNKSFIVMTFLSPLLFVGIAVFVGYLASMKADLKRIVIHDASGYFVNEFKNDAEFSYHDLSKIDVNFVRDSIISERYEGLIYFPKTDSLTDVQKRVQYISNDSQSMEFIFDIEKKIENKFSEFKAELDCRFKDMGSNSFKHIGIFIALMTPFLSGVITYIVNRLMRG